MGLKNFLDKRAEGVAREKAKKEGKEYVKPKPKKTETVYEVDKEKGIIQHEKEIEEVEENPNLTDDEFWAISNDFMAETKSNKDGNPVEMLQKILEEYTPLKIQQFADRYAELNK